MVVIKCRIIAKPREGTRPIYRIRNDDKSSKCPNLLYEESLAEGLSTFVVGVVTSLHIMFLERKYLSMLCFSVQIVINITKPNVEVRPLISPLEYHMFI
jgi:hypothetical protein